MKFLLSLILGLVFIAGFTSNTRAESAGLLVPFKNLPKLELQFNLGDQQPEWALVKQQNSEAQYKWQDYNLELKTIKNGEQQLLSFKLTRQDNSRISLLSYSATAYVPLAGLHSVMVPNTRPIGKQLDYYHANHKWRENVTLYRCLIPESFKEKAIVNNEAPFILLSDNKGNNRFSIGWALADTASALNGALDSNYYKLTLSRTEDQPFTGTSIEDALIINTAKKPWMNVETSYAKQFDIYNGRKHDVIPEWATDPVFCTWYCYSENIDQDLMLKAAKKSKELGIDTFLIDAGWDAIPGCAWGDLNKCLIGDYAVSKNLFPDFTGMVKQMHDMGLRVELWAAPFWMSKGSKAYKEAGKDWMIWTEEGEDIYLCPKHPQTRGFLKDKFTMIAKNYGIDGMWLDVCDGVASKCLANHEHLNQPMGDAWVDCMMAVRDGLKSVNPGAITEARILHANLNSKVALDVVQCGDSPKNYEMIRLALIHLKPWAYDIVVKNDPMMWPKDADIPTIGKYMATMITSGVPAMSVDFLSTTNEQNQVIKAWLNFYKQHKATLVKGEFKLFGENYGIPDMMLIGKDEAVIYMKNPKTKFVELPKQVKRVYVLNCTEADNINIEISPIKGNCDIKSYNQDWTEVGLPASKLANRTLHISQFIPQGGAALIEVH